MTQNIHIRQAPGTWALRVAGAVIGETKSAIELSEGNLPPVIYFPRADLAMALLEQSDKTTHCPHKGDAVHFTLHTKSGEIENAAWSYETPNADVNRIKEHIAFYADERVTVEQL